MAGICGENGSYLQGNADGGENCFRICPSVGSRDRLYSLREKDNGFVIVQCAVGLLSEVIAFGGKRVGCVCFITPESVREPAKAESLIRRGGCAEAFLRRVKRQRGKGNCRAFRAGTVRRKWLYLMIRCEPHRPCPPTRHIKLFAAGDRERGGNGGIRKNTPVNRNTGARDSRYVEPPPPGGTILIHPLASSILRN